MRRKDDIDYFVDDILDEVADTQDDIPFDLNDLQVLGKLLERNLRKWDALKRT